MSMLVILVAFVAGVLSFALLQLSVLYYLLRRYLRHPAARISPSSSSAAQAQDDHKFPPSRLSLQGEIWIATVPSSDAREATKKNAESSDKPAKESKKKKDGTKDVPEVHPVRVFARVDGQILFVKDGEKDEEAIHLDGFDVRAVSGGPGVSRKWAKKYPIKLQSGSKPGYSQKCTFFIYLETSWKKEIWCQVLRAASGLGSYTEDRYIHLKEEFKYYCRHLNEVYPALWLHQQNSTKDKHHKKETSKYEATGISRKRLLWKKFTRKGSSKGNGHEGKSRVASGETSNSAHTVQPQSEDGGGSLDNVENNKWSDDSTKSLDRKPSVKLSTTDLLSESSSFGETVAIKSNNRISAGTDTCADMSDGSLDEASLIHMSNISVDQGTLCWNMLFSRLFFDFYHSHKFKAACKQLIEKQFLKVTLPSYIGHISCKNLDLGAVPPFLYRMHALPMNVDGEWAVEADVDYSGGALLTVETRLDVCDSISQEKVVNESFEHTLAGAAAADLLRSVEEDLETDRVVNSEVDAIFNSSKGSNNEPRMSKMSKSASRGAWMQSSKARLKSVLSHVAEQVSQVPFTLSVRVVSLKGTLKIRVKSPPSDRIWFGFVSMPDIELQPEPSIGDHKISTGPLADFLANRIKISLNDSLVLPNSQDILISEMMSENDDWLPEVAVPIPWSPLDNNRSSSVDNVQAVTSKSMEESSRSNQSNLPPVLSKQKSLVKETEQKIPNRVLSVQSSSRSLPVVTESSLTDNNSDLIRPLLDKVNPSFEENEGNQALVAVSSDTEVNASSENIDEGKRKQGSRRAKMLNFGRKVGERLDGKARNMLDKVLEGLEKSEYGDTRD